MRVYNKCIKCYSHYILKKLYNRMTIDDKKQFRLKYKNKLCQFHSFLRLHNVKEKIKIKK